jgi:hypothetical protein
MNPIYQFLKENNLTTKDEKTFERDYSDSAKAKELYGFFQENKLTEKDFNSFYDTYLKKKEPSQVVSSTGGKAGTSGLPSGLTPRTDVVEFKEPKVSGEDTALARRIQRQQQQAIATTGVRLPAALEVSEDKAAQRAAEPKLPAITKDETPKTERFFKGGFGKLLDILDTPGISIIPLGDFIDDMGRSIETGRKQGNTITPSIELMTKGAKSSPDDIRKFIETAQNVGEIPPSDEMLKFRDTYEKEGKDIFGFIKGLAQNPGVAPQIMASSISALVTNPASLATFGSIVGGGAALGAATGPGAAATAAASLPYAMGAASGVLETGATFAELLQDELGKRKLDFTEDNVKKILEDQKTLSSLRSRAATRGATIGVIDALTGRIAGRVGAKISTTTAAGRVKSGLAAAGIEAVGGSTGEAVARQAIGQEMDIAEIGLEGFAQAPTAVVSVASEIYKQPTYKVNGEVRTKADVEEILANAPTEEIKNAKIEVENDPVVESQIKEKVETGDIKRELREVAPEISDEKAERIASLEKQLKKFEQGTTQLSKDKAASIREEIKTISKEPEAAPEVPEAPKQKYRVEYFDPAKGEMTHSFFDTREEGDAFTSSLTDQQKSKGIQAYFQETTEPSMKLGEEVIPQVPAAPVEAEVVSIDEKETIRQMKPFTDEMANIEREFENRGFKIDTDYDNEIIVTDRQGNILDPEEIPADIADLAAAYEQATMKLGEFDQVAREKALEESRKVEEVVGEEVAQVSAAPVEEGFRPLEGFEGFEVEEGVTPIQAKQISRMKDKAMSLESTNPRTIVMQYFINGGKINKSAIQELYGISEGAARIRLKRGVPTEEMKVKKSLLSDKAPGLEALSESFAERLMQFSETQVDNRDFVDAIAEVLQDFNSVRPMIQELASEYDQQQYSGVTQGDLKDLEAAVTAELEEVVAGLPETVKTELLQFLDKYRTAEGFVDWAKVEEVSNDFDPDYLSLSEETAKAIKDEIQRNVYGQRISRPAVEDIKKAGDAARRLAERIRQGKINKLGGFRAGTGFDAVWDASLEVIAKALEGGASVTDAIEQGLKYAKSTGWYKKLTNPADFDKKYREQLNEEYNAIQEQAAGEVPVQPEARVGEEVEGRVPPAKPPKPPKEGETEGESEKELDYLANNVPDTGKVAEYLSKGTIEKYTGETPINEQLRGVQELRIALEHGEKIIEKAKEVFGEDYVEKALDYIENSTASVSNKALMYVSLENALGKEKLANPDRAGEITKQQALVYTQSQAFARESALALNYQKLRKVALLGYDTSRITDNLFSSQELEDKQTLSKAIEATPEQVNQAEEETVKEEEAKLYTEAELEQKVEQGVKAEIDKLFEQLPKKDKTRAEKALDVLADFKKKLRGRAYDATIGIPVAIIEAGVTTIENAIKLGISVEKAIDLGIKKIKERLKGKSWDKENDFRNDMLDAYKNANVDTKATTSPTTKKQAVKDALIKSGFGRTVTIKGEEREILDWKKLAGKAGTVEKIQANVEKVLKEEGYSQAEIDASKDEFTQEYVDLRQSIIEKAQNELARRNKTTVSPKQKSAAKRLAELYSFGLFEQKKNEFENLVNSALGTEVDEKTFDEVNKIAEAMENIYNQTFNGVRLNDLTAKSALEKLEDRLRVLLYEQSKKQGNVNYKIASLVRGFMNFSQTMILNNIKNSIENFSSGLQQKLLDKLFLTIGKEKTPELVKERRQLMKDIYKDMIVNGGIGYGKVENEFVNRRHIDDYVNKLSDKKLYQGIASVLTGKATLNAMDAMFKAGLTEARFTSNLIRILTSPSNKNQMSKQDAIKFVSEQLTGQTLEQARVTAKDVIDKINQDAGQELVKPNKEQINRLANDIVKAALEMNGTITSDQIIAAYDAAYKSAGLSIGHEANNMLTAGVRALSAKYEGQINQAIREKDWNKAALLIYKSVLWNNILNPFVGGGTNWLVLKLEKTGLGLFTGLIYEVSGKKDIDVSTKTGMAQLEKRLTNQSRAKDSYMRGAVGGLSSLLLYGAFLGIADEEEYRKWRAKNKWATKYLDMFTPEYLLAAMASKDKRLPQYVESSILGKNDAFSSHTKVVRALTYAAKGDSPKAWGAIGEAAGAKINTPLPWRLIRDGEVLYDGIRGEDPYHGNYKPSIGFWSGVLQGGAIEWLGLRPTGSGKVQVGSFKVVDEATEEERDATNDEIKQVENLSNINYKNYLPQYKNNAENIWATPMSTVKISKEGYSNKEIGLWEEKTYQQLTKEQQDQLDDLIKKRALNDAKAELGFK